MRDWLFASVADPLNSPLIKTEEGGSPFDKNTMIIFTADREVYERVAAAARAPGYPASMLNLYTLPSSVLRRGLSPGSYMFSIVACTANVKSQGEGKRYLCNAHWAQVFRVTPRTIPPHTPCPSRRRALAAGGARARWCRTRHTPRSRSWVADC